VLWYVQISSAKSMQHCANFCPYDKRQFLKKMILFCFPRYAIPLLQFLEDKKRVRHQREPANVTEATRRM
jgi:hypothetical protein